MKSTPCILIILAILGSSIIRAQDGHSLETMSSPSLPAFAIIDKSTEEVSRPTDFRAVTTTLQNAVGTNGFVGDIGIEFNPFWMKRRQALEYNSYFAETDFGPSLLKQMAKNTANSFAISIATAAYSPDNTDIEGKKLGLGLRFQPIRGHATDSLRNLNETLALVETLHFLSADPILESQIRDKTLTLEQKKELVLSACISLIDADTQMSKEQKSIAKESLQAMLNDAQSSDMILKGLNEFNNKIKKTLGKDLYERFDKSFQERVGLIVEISAATFVDFPTNSFELSYGRKTAGWITLDYRTENTTFDFIALGRLIFNHETNRQNQDLGFRFNINLEGLSIGTEAIMRSEEFRYETLDIDGNEIIALESSSSWRYDINFQYKLNEEITLSGVFGKDWVGEITGNANLLAQIGVNLSFGKRKFI